MKASEHGIVFTDEVSVQSDPSPVADDTAVAEAVRRFQASRAAHANQNQAAQNQAAAWTLGRPQEGSPPETGIPQGPVSRHSSDAPVTTGEVPVSRADHQFLLDLVMGYGRDRRQTDVDLRALRAEVADLRSELRAKGRKRKR